MLPGEHEVGQAFMRLWFIPGLIAEGSLTVVPKTAVFKAANHTETQSPKDAGGGDAGGADKEKAEAAAAAEAALEVARKRAEEHVEKVMKTAQAEFDKENIAAKSPGGEKSSMKFNKKKGA